MAQPLTRRHRSPGRQAGFDRRIGGRRPPMLADGFRPPMTLRRQQPHPAAIPAASGGSGQLIEPDLAAMRVQIGDGTQQQTLARTRCAGQKESRPPPGSDRPPAAARWISRPGAAPAISAPGEPDRFGKRGRPSPQRIRWFIVRARPESPHRIRRRARAVDDQVLSESDSRSWVRHGGAWPCIRRSLKAE